MYRGILNRSIAVAIKTVEDERTAAKKGFIEEIACLMNLRHANVRATGPCQPTLPALAVMRASTCGHDHFLHDLKIILLFVC